VNLVLDHIAATKASMAAPQGEAQPVAYEAYHDPKTGSLHELLLAS